MSYCVNCGVELATSERYCPLCRTEVINPANPWREPDMRPYPKRVEKIMQNVDRKYGTLLVSMILLVPIVLPVLTDILFNSAVTWSAYVMGGGMCIYFWFVFPLLFSAPRPYLFWALDSAVTIGYIALISYMSSNLSWFLPLGFPLALVASVTALVFIAVVKSTRIPGLFKAAVLLAALGISCVAIELSISLFFKNTPILLWSLFVVASCLIIATIFVLLERRKKLKEKIIKRLFI